MADWRDRAACKEKTDWFFLERGDDSEPARALCATCPVQRDCLTYAIETGQEYGIWAGRSIGRLRKGERLYRMIRCGMCNKKFRWDPTDAYGQPPTYCGDGCRESARRRVYLAANKRARQGPQRAACYPQAESRTMSV